MNKHLDEIDPLRNPLRSMKVMGINARNLRPTFDVSPSLIIDFDA